MLCYVMLCYVMLCMKKKNVDNKNKIKINVTGWIREYLIM